MRKELSNDYEGKCGNCHSPMLPNAKYCRYCGTPRGKGAFEPYENVFYCVYGPPIKKVFKCQSCGHRWIGVALGGDRSKYCPQCSSEQLDVERDDMYSFLDFIGTELSEELSDGYQYLSEEEVDQLLNLRTTQKEDYEEVAKRIMEHGFTDWYKAENSDGELTEIEAERANLERMIVEKLDEEDPIEMHKNCPMCNGKRITKYTNALSPHLLRDDDPRYLCLQCKMKFT